MSAPDPNNLDLTGEVLSRSERLVERLKEDRKLLNDADERDAADLIQDISRLIDRLMEKLKP